MITDREVETRLRTALEAVAETTQVEERPAVRLELSAAAPGRRWSVRPAISLAFGFLLVLVSVGMALVVSGRGGESAPGSAPPVIERYPVFGMLPDGVGVSAEFSVPPEKPRFVKLVVGRRTETGFTDAVNVIIWEDHEAITIPDGETVMVGSAVGVVVPSEAAERTDVGATVFWHEGELLLQTHDPRGRVDLALSIAEIIEVDTTGALGAGSVGVGRLPNGMELLAAPELSGRDPIAFVTAQFGDGRLLANLSRSNSPEAGAVLGGSGEAIEVRGRPGYHTHFAEWEILTWQEASGVTAKLSATEGIFTIDELLGYADGLTFVDETTWRTIYESALLPDRVGSTTAGSAGDLVAE